MKTNNINYGILIISVSIVFVMVILLGIFPEQGLNTINEIFEFVSNVFGIPMLWFSFACTVLCTYIAFSKYGNIKLGEEEPSFSLFSYIGMMICAGLASASVYFSFVEWVFYYMTPALGIKPGSTAAAEWASAYNFLHWGLVSWPPFAIAAMPVAYSYYKKKNKGLRFSVVCESMLKSKSESFLGKAIDILFIVTVLGGLSVTLGLGIPLISTNLAFIFRIENTFGFQVLIVIAISVIFSLSSFLGIEKGMKVISDTNIYFAIIFVFFILIAGPTLFIIKQITNGVGLFLQNYFKMALWTDPIEGGSFSADWTVFFICFAITYTPLMSLFITKISKGRTLREMIGSIVIGGTFGCILLFGINGSFGIYAQITEALDVTSALTNEGGPGTIIAILSQLPVPHKLSVLAFTIIATLFLATSLDSASFSLAVTVTKNLGVNDNPNPFLRLFWCLTLSLIPLCIMFIGAPMSALQTVALVTGVPFSVVIVFFSMGLMKWLKQDTIDNEKIHEKSIFKV